MSLSAVFLGIERAPRSTSRHPNPKSTYQVQTLLLLLGPGYITRDNPRQILGTAPLVLRIDLAALTFTNVTIR